MAILSEGLREGKERSADGPGDGARIVRVLACRVVFGPAAVTVVQVPHSDHFLTVCRCAEEERRTAVAIPLAAEPSHSTGVAFLETDRLDSTTTTSLPNIVVLPRLLRNLTTIQLHVLGRVATHCWTRDGSIPYVPPTAHQRAVVRELAASPFCLVTASMEGRRRASFRLTRLGELAARQVLHVVLAAPDAAREKQFDRICRLMRHGWEPSGDLETADD